MYDIPGKFGRVTTQMPADCMVHGCTRLNARSVIEHKPTCPHYDLHAPARAREVFLCEKCGGSHPTEYERTICARPPAADPPADWLMVWMSGYLAGYATGYDHGHEDGEHEYGATLADALAPMRRAAAHGIDVAIARGAWQEQQRRMGGAAAA